MTTENTIEYASRTERPLRARDIFGIIVRTIGLLITIYGSYTLLYVAVDLRGITLNIARWHWIYILFGLFYIACGVCLIRGSWLVDFAYGRD